MSEMKKFLRASQKGYIDDIGDIDRILSRLVKLTPSELDPKDEFHIQFNAEVLLVDSKNPVDSRKITYGEILGLMDNIISDKADPCHEINAKNTKRCLYMFLSALKQNRGGNVTVKLFLAMTVKGYFGYLATIAGWAEKSVNNIFRIFRTNFHHATNYTIGDETTVSQLFDEITRQLSIWWDISAPIEDYQQRILGCYDALYAFFIDYFKIGFYSYFDT